MQPAEPSLFADAMRDAQGRIRYAEWLRQHGRLGEAEVWERPQIEIERVAKDDCFEYAFHAALFDEPPKRRFGSSLQAWMKPIRHVFLVADGEEFPIDDSEGGATWLAAVLYEDGKGDRFLVIESWFDELAGWVGEASRHASLGDLLKQLTGEQIQRFGLR